MSCICDKLGAGHPGLSSTCLADLWLFQHLEPSDLSALLDAAWRSQYETGEIIFLQDERADKMFLIKAGRVKLTKFSERGHEIILDIRKAGDMLGENMLSEDADYPLTAECMETTLLCGFNRARFERLVVDYPKIAFQVIRNLSNLISSLTTRMGSMSETKLEDRLYAVLENVAHEHGEKKEQGYVIQFPLTHEELGFLVGAHRVSITRAMKNLRESGRISQEQGRLVLPRTG